MSDVFAFRQGIETLNPYPVGSATVIEVGQFVMLDGGGLLVPVAADTDFLAAIGIAKEAKRSQDTYVQKITVALFNAQAIYDYALDASTDIAINDGLAINNTQSLKKSATKVLAKAVEAKTGALSIRVKFLIPAGDVRAAS